MLFEDKNGGKIVDGDAGMAEADQLHAEAIDLLRKHGGNGFMLFVLPDDTAETIRVVASVKNVHHLPTLQAWYDVLNSAANDFAQAMGTLLAQRLMRLLFGEESEDDNA